jgi:hypothetical protein
MCKSCSLADMCYYYYYYYIYIPWIIIDKSHLDIWIVNIDMDATKQMYIKYEYNYGLRKQITVRSWREFCNKHLSQYENKTTQHMRVSFT